MSCLKKCTVPIVYSDTDQCRVLCQSSLGRETWQILDSGWHLLVWLSVSPCRCHPSAADTAHLALTDGSTSLSPGGGGTEKCLFSQTDSNSGNDGELWVAFCWKLFIISTTWLSESHSVCIVRFFMFWRGIKISKCIKNTQMAGSVRATSEK